VGQAVGQQAGRLDAADHVAEHLLHHLEAADLLLEHDAAAGVGHGGVDARLGQPHRPRRDAEAAVLDGVQRDRHAAALLAHERVERDLDVVQHQLARGQGPEAVLVRHRPHLEAGRVPLDDEGAHALAAALVHPVVGEGEEVGGHVEEADPHLAAADDVAVVLARVAGVHVGDVGARAGLRHPGAGEDLAPREGREVALLLLLGAEALDRVADQAAREGEGAGDDVADLGDLLDHHRVAQVVEPGAAVLGRHDAAGQAEAAGRAGDLGRKPLLAVVVGDVRGDLVAREVAGERDELELVRGRRQVHGGGSLLDLQPTVW